MRVFLIFLFFGVLGIDINPFDKSTVNLWKENRDNLINCSISFQTWINTVLSQKYIKACECINKNAGEFITVSNKIIESNKEINSETLKAINTDLDFYISSLMECYYLEQLNRPNLGLFEHSNLPKLLELKNKLKEQIESKTEQTPKSKTEKELKNIAKHSKDETKLDMMFDGKSQYAQKSEIEHPKIKETQNQNTNKSNEEKWKEIETKLKDALLDEIKDTKAGDEILKFYSDPKNKLNFKLKNIDGFGHWDPINEELVVNKKLIDQYLEKKGVTHQQILKDEKLLKEIAAYIGPTFVHEATHQKQTAWAKEKDIKIEYYTPHGRKLTLDEVIQCKKAKNCGEIKAVLPLQTKLLRL